MLTDFDLWGFVMLARAHRRYAARHGLIDQNISAVNYLKNRFVKW
jgi:hypothetical protein